MSCQVCNNLRPDTLALLKSGQHATYFIDDFDLINSVKASNCEECKLLFDALSLKTFTWPTAPSRSRSIELTASPGRPLHVTHRNKAGYLRISRQSNIGSSDQTSAVPDIIGDAPQVSAYSGSDECLAQLQSWYTACAASHPLCKIPDGLPLPTRVIDVGTATTSSADAFLRETSGDTGRYMALSYCWGDPAVHKALKTTRSNLSLHKSRVVFADLPLTLQHAVKLARSLQLQFLWVDSLCIVQDDAADWLREASTMCDVYSNAAITVVACQSDGSSNGIFGTQQFSLCTPTPYKSTFVNVSENYERLHSAVQFHSLAYDLHDPIHRRAWTMQEAILSSRAIYFTSQELRWECNSCSQCQCGKISVLHSPTFNHDQVDYDNCRVWRLNDFFPAETLKEAYNWWSLLYAAFSIRSLTVETDRLVALSGLARRFSIAMEAKFHCKDKYLAGLWAGSLPRDLLWRASGKSNIKQVDRRHQRPRVWRAPSWSWASMEIPTSRPTYGDLQPKIQIIDATCELSGSDPFGQIKSGYMTVKAPILRNLRFHYDADSHSTRYFPSVRYNDQYNLRIETLFFDDDQGDETDTCLKSADAAQDLVLIVVGYSPGGDLHEALLLAAVNTTNHASNTGTRSALPTFSRIGIVPLGPHLREPKEHKAVIENAPRETVVIV